MSKDSTLGLSPERLACLLGISLGSESDEEEENSAHSASQLIQARLAGTLPLDTTVVDELPAILGQLRKDLMPHGGRTLGEALTDPDSDLGIIKKIRKYAKKMTSRKVSEAERAVAIALYFAAIAHGLVFHDVKITTYSYDSLIGSFNKLIGKAWMPRKLRELYIQACEVCKGRFS